MNDYFEHLQKIPLKDSYAELKETLFVLFDQFVDDCGCSDAINHTIFNFLDDEMNENGMTKAINNIVSVLYLMKYSVLDNVICYDAYCDIKDLETGDYDALFKPDDLELIKKDIATIKDYIAKHPELIKD